MNKDQDLLQRSADGVATDDEMLRLAIRLDEDAALRARYLDLMNLDTALQARADGALLEPVKRPAQAGWLRPYAAAAAGIILGGLAVGTAWAMTSPNEPRRQPMSLPLPLADGGFELGHGPRLAGVPAQFNVWQGDPADVLESHGAVLSHGGRHFLRFQAASNSGDRDDGKHIACDLWQVLALPELPNRGPGIARVQAFFNSNAASKARFHLMAMTTDAPPTGAPELWAQRYEENSLVPSAAQSMVSVDENPSTLERGEVVLHVPAGARTLVVAIAAYRVSTQPQTDWFPGQYVDDVSVDWIAE